MKSTIVNFFFLLLIATFYYPQNVLAQDDSALKTMMAMEKVITSAIEKAENSVVAIARVRKGSIGDPTDPNFVPNEYGTGVVIDQGKIVTNYHVLGKPEENDYYIWVKRRPFKVVKVMKAAKVKAADPWTDLAVLEVKADDLQPIKFGDTKDLRKGKIVIALGNPYAIAREGDASATWGIVSNLYRKSTAMPTEKSRAAAAETMHEYGTLIQTDAKLNFGTSGGALLNLKGEMIGLTTSLAAMYQYEKSAGFAIPVDETFKRTIKSLKAGKIPEFGFLGVSPGDIRREARADGEFGVRVNMVVRSSPAEKAKIAFGDVITHVNDVKVSDSGEFMRELVGRNVNEQLKITLRRRNFQKVKPDSLNVNVKLAKRFIDTKRKAFSESQPRIWEGLEVDYYTAIPEFGDVARDVDAKGCVVVTKVKRDSNAWKSGVRPRMFISHLNSKRVSSPQDFFKIVESANQDSKEFTLKVSSADPKEQREIKLKSTG